MTLSPAEPEPQPSRTVAQCSCEDAERSYTELWDWASGMADRCQHAFDRFRAAAGLSPSATADEIEGEIGRLLEERAAMLATDHQQQANLCEAYEQIAELRAENARLANERDRAVAEAADLSRASGVQAAGQDQAVIEAAREALKFMPHTCRYHGQDFEFLGMRWGYPRCESCRAPFWADQLRAAVARSAPASPPPVTSEPIPAPTAPPEEDDRG